MKTITIKLPNEEVIELEDFIKRKNYVSKSEFIRNLIMEKLDLETKVLLKEYLGKVALIYSMTGFLLKI